jgi:hypothetical protein
MDRRNAKSRGRRLAGLAQNRQTYAVFATRLGKFADVAGMGSGQKVGQGGQD